MILDTLDRADRYAALHPGFAAAFAFLRRADLAALPDGRRDINGDRVFALVSRYTPKPVPEALRWEAHRAYIDIQFLVTGSEQLGWAPRATLRETETHDVAKDCAFFAGDGTLCTLRAGQFAVFFPEDAHAPGHAAGAPAPVQKIVVKVAAY